MKSLLLVLALTAGLCGALSLDCATTRQTAIDCGVDVAPDVLRAVELAIHDHVVAGIPAALDEVKRRFGLCLSDRAVDAWLAQLPRLDGTDVKVDAVRAWRTAHPLR